MKKSQMELMGLAIIVILISIAMLFVIRFVLNKEPSTTSQEYQESELAANFLNTLVETSADGCMGIKFSKLFQDCAEYREISCPTHGNSCVYLEETTRNISDTTFNIWQINYSFVATTSLESPSDDMLFEALGTGCFERKRKVQPLPSDPPVYLILDICN
jgi:hypothetical protein